MKRRLLIVNAEDEDQPHDVLRLYDLDFEGRWGWLVSCDGFNDTKEDRLALIEQYYEIYPVVVGSEYEARYVDKTSEGVRASNPDYHTALKYFEEGQQAL